MGVRGLTTFIDCNPHFLQDHRFHDSKLVIDGNNFYYFLYYYCHVRYQFGGDYDQYSKKVKEIFQTLRACNIEPYVVFDGGYETDGRKLKTTLHRAKERIHLAGFISHGRHGKVLPILAYETFKTTLDLIGVPHVTCDFEADRQLVTLANMWNCPLLSNDSDFFIFNLKAGLIILDYVDFRISYAEDEQSGEKFSFISTQLFHIEHFVKSVKGIDKSCMPLFASLLGNDFVDPGIFGPFFSQLKYSQKSTKNKTSTSKKFSKMFAVLQWLRQCRNISEATASLLDNFKTTKQQYIHTILDKSVKSYTDPETFESFHLLNYFQGDPRTESSMHTEECKAYNGSSLPVWFVQSLRCGYFSGFYIQNSIVLHRIVQQTQVEDLSQPSTYVMTEKIRRVMYGILLKEDIAAVKDQNSSNQSQHVVEYVREMKNLKKIQVAPIMDLPGFGELPTISDVMLCSVTRRQQIILETLSIERKYISQFSPDLQLIMACVLFWITNAEPKVTKHHLDAVLMCFIFLHTKARLERSDSAETTVNELILSSSQRNENVSEPVCEISVTHTVTNVATEKELTMVCNNLNKHHKEMQKVTNSNPIEPRVTHGFSQLQACILDTIHLNQVLLCPFLNPDLPTLINCTFLYNLCRDLHVRADTKICIQGMLIKGSPLADIFISMQSAVLGVISEDVFYEAKSKKKKNARKRDKKKMVKSEISECAEDSENVNTENQFDTVASCDLDNKFSALLLDGNTCL